MAIMIPDPATSGWWAIVSSMLGYALLDAPLALVLLVTERHSIWWFVLPHLALGAMWGANAVLAISERYGFPTSRRTGIAVLVPAMCAVMAGLLRQRMVTAAGDPDPLPYWSPTAAVAVCLALTGWLFLWSERRRR